MDKYGLLVGLLVLCLSTSAHAEVDLKEHIRNNDFNDIKISPDGEHFAATVPLEDKTGLAIIRRSDSKVISSFSLGKDNHVYDFDWANKERLLIRVAQKFGMLEQPQATGEVIAMTIGEKGVEPLVGYRASSGGVGSRIGQGSSKNNVAAITLDRIPGDERNVIITTAPYSEDELWTRAERLDVYTGKRETVARAPVKGSNFFTDNKGVVRFARGSEYDNASKLYHRDNDDAEWKLVNDENVSGRVESPVGFSDDNRVAYLQVEQPTGPDAIVSYDTVSGERKEVLRDKSSDPTYILNAFGASNAPVGAMYLDGRPHTRFFDDASKEAKLYKMLQTAFPNDAVMVTSTTDDGKTALVSTSSDRDPGSFYLFDTETKKAG